MTDTWVIWAQLPAPNGTSPVLRFEVKAPTGEAARQHIRIQLGMCAQAALVDPVEGEMIFISEEQPSE